MDKLPRPVTIDQHYLAAILAELRDIRPAQTVAEPQPGDLVALRGVKTPVPPDFPGAEALAEAGIDCLEAVPRDGDQLVALPGIGKVTAGRILGALT